MIIHDCDQMSEEWFRIKAGIPSAGSLDKIITSKGEPSKQAEGYLYQLAGESILNAKQATFTSYAMERGIEFEAEARRLYEFQNNVTVDQVGFCVHDSGLVGCSPDGIMHNKGLEIKCPLLHTHVGYLDKGKLPTTYFQQVQGSLYVTGYDAWIFMSYYPGIKPLVVTVEPDGKWHKALEEQLEIFNEKLNALVERLTK